MESASNQNAEEAVLDKNETKNRSGKRKRFSKEGLKLLKSSYDKRGICYLGYIPPGMRPHILQRVMSEYAEITRVHLQGEDGRSWHRRKMKGGDRRRFYTEGWVEFADKRIAKRTAAILNGEPMGGRHRSRFFHELWCIKYLPKFKWEDLQEGIEYQKQVFQHQLRVELSQAKKDQEFYLSKVNQAQKEERRKKSAAYLHEEKSSVMKKPSSEAVDGHGDGACSPMGGKRKRAKGAKNYFSQTKAHCDPVLEGNGGLSDDVMMLIAGKNVESAS